MPDSLTRTAASFGVPEVSLPRAPSVFGGGGTGFFQAQALENQNRNRLVRTLEFRSQVSDLMRGEQARSQGAAAMSQLSRLNPRDPDYLDKRNQIISANPNAALDETAAAFLGLQEDVFADAEADRQADASFEDSARRAEFQETLFEARDKRRLATAKEQAKLDEQEAGLEGLSSFGQDQFLDYKNAGFTEEAALKKAQADDENESAVVGLLEAGLSEADIYGLKDANGAPVTDAEGNAIKPGVLDAEGRVDRRKVAEFVGQQKIRAQAELAAKEERRRLEQDLKLLNEQLESAGHSTGVKEPLLKAIAEINKKLGLVPEEPVEGAEGAPVSTTSTVSGKPVAVAPEADPRDRYFQ
jgi:hypothetical protein